MKHRNKLLRAFHCPPQCHDWDDFFDFSRWSLPNHSRNIPSRAWSNMTSSFTGNYVWCWLDVMFIIGLINKKILMAQAVIVCLWCAICLATEQTVPTERKITRSSVRAFSLNQRLLVLVTLGNCVLFFTTGLIAFYAVTSLVFIFICIHAAGRAVIGESIWERPRKVVASDGFVDVDDTEETLVFHEQRPFNGDIRIQRRILRCKNDTNQAIVTGINRRV